jgi:hypothetical protein
MLKAVQQRKLIDEDSTQGESLGVDQPFGRHLTMRVENAFDVLIEVLNGCLTQLAKDAPDLFWPKTYTCLTTCRSGSRVLFGNSN